MAEFLLRLRANSTGIKDLAGNTLSITGVDYSTAGKFSGGRALYFDGQDTTKLDYFTQAGISEGQDFTVAFWYKIAEDAWNAGAGVIGKIKADQSVVEFSVWYNHRARPENSAEVFMNNSRIISVNTTTLPKSDMFSSTTWKHCALTRRNNTVRLFINGVKYAEVVDNSSVFNDISLTPVRLMRYSQSNTDINSIQGYLDDVCIIKGKALWTDNFTPPTDYLKGIPFYAYLSNNNLYTGTSLTNLTTNWSGLTNTEKEALVESFSEKIPSIQDLATISPFRVLTDDTSLENVKVTGQPKVQTIEPTSLINTVAVSTVQSINITNTLTDVTVKFAITTNLTTYKVYDAIEGDWVTSTNIEEDGMSIAQINALTPQILALLDVSDGIAFKQCFIATSENASAEVSEISAVVDIDGSWSQSVHGTDYSVSYPNKTTMSVRLLTNGDYIINYPISSNS